MDSLKSQPFRILSFTFPRTKKIRILGKQYLVVRIENVQVIAPDHETIASIKGSIDLVRKSKKHWNAFRRTGFTIFVTKRKRLENSLLVERGTRGIWFIDGGLLGAQSSLYNASLLLHESRHVSQFYRRNMTSMDPVEDEAYKFQISFLREFAAGKRYAKKLSTILRRKGWEQQIASKEYQEAVSHFKKIKAELCRRKILGVD